MKFKLILVLVYIPILSLFAQDPQYSHLYAVPLYMGPSFAGSSGATRVAINARDQWTAIRQEYFTCAVMADHYFYGTRNGGGILLQRDQAGIGKLITSSANLYYAYSADLTKKFSMRPGIQFSYVNRTIDYSKIKFGDQLDFEQDREISLEPSLYSDVNYIDFSASLLSIYMNYWFGFTADHIVTPNQSLLHQNSEVPMKLSFYAGGKFNINTTSKRKRYRENLYVMAHYNTQDKARQSFFGAYWEHQQSIVGVWYRGTPFAKSYENYMNTDAVIFMLGIRRGGVTFLYSYDFTVSKLSSNTAGSQEITVSWVFKNENSEKAKKNRMRVVPCPMSEGAKHQYHQQRSM